MAAKLFAASSRTLESESDLLAINNGWHILQTPATIHVLQLCYSSSILLGFSPIHHSPLTLLQSIQTKSIKQLLKNAYKKAKNGDFGSLWKGTSRGCLNALSNESRPCKDPSIPMEAFNAESETFAKYAHTASSVHCISLPWTTSVFQPSCASFESHQPHFVAEASSQR